MKKLLLENLNKMQKSISLVQKSVARLKPFIASTDYTELELEPYDALASRFERAIEVTLNKTFRSIELFETGISSDLLRDRLGQMEKWGYISSVDLWMSMRDIRNRIAHDYLPEQLQQIYNDIMVTYTQELSHTLQTIETAAHNKGWKL